MGKVNSKYALIALSSIFALSMFGCTKTRIHQKWEDI